MMLRLVKRLALASALSLGLAGFSSPAFSSVLIDFFQAGTGAGGLITNVGGGAIVGSEIPINGVFIDGAPVGDGTYDVTGDCGGFGCLDFAFGGGSNFVTITGSIDDLGLTDLELLSGSYSSFSVNANGKGIEGTGPDDKHPDLLEALGLDPNEVVFKHFGFAITGVGQPGNLNEEENPIAPTSTDITNSTVPEPGTLALMGLGLGIVGFASKRKSKRG